MSASYSLQITRAGFWTMHADNKSAPLCFNPNNENCLHLFQLLINVMLNKWNPISKKAGSQMAAIYCIYTHYALKCRRKGL